mgnify:CR=1 FL=1
MNGLLSRNSRSLLASGVLVTGPFDASAELLLLLLLLLDAFAALPLPFLPFALPFEAALSSLLVSIPVAAGAAAAAGFAEAELLEPFDLLSALLSAATALRSYRSMHAHRCNAGN